MPHTLPWNKIQQWRRDGLTVAAADGCFDLLHVGHLRMLTWAASRADKLIVLLLDDAGVAVAKPERPFNNLAFRLELVAGLKPVDAVGHYSQDALADLYASLHPDAMVNSPEWRGRVIGQAEVEAGGGEVLFFPLAGGESTTNLLSRIRGADG